MALTHDYGPQGWSKTEEVILLPLILNARGQNVQQVLDRLALFCRRAQSLAVSLRITSPARPGVGTARLVFVRPNRMSYTFHWNDIEYRFSETPQITWDANLGTKTYCDYPDWPKLAPPSATISPAPRIMFPGFLPSGDLRALGVGRFKTIPSAEIGGTLCDGVEGISTSARVDLYVGADGRPLRYVIFSQSGRYQADLSNWQINKNQSGALFGGNPPLGFHEYSVPLPVAPLAIGSQFPLLGWTALRGSTDFAAVVQAKPTLVLLTDRASGPAQRSAASLTKLAGRGVCNVAVVSLDPRGGVPPGLQAFPCFSDPLGSNVRLVNPPGSPLYYLLHAGGKVAKVWYGYDAGNGAAFEKDVALALKQ